MSRDDAQSRIDSINNIRTSSLNTSRNTRTALNNAVRYNAMLQLFDDREPDYNNPEDVRRTRIRNSLGAADPRRVSDSQLANALDASIRDLTEEFNRTVDNDDLDYGTTPQSKLTNRAFRTELGQITSNEIAFNRGRFFEANSRGSLLDSGKAGYAFNQFTSSFVQGNDDAFGSRVLYDNVFGHFEDGEKSLSERAKEINPEDYAATATQKVLQTLVNKNISDSRTSINKVDREFERFFGQSAVAAASESGGGLVRARQILDYSIERSIELRREESQIRSSLGGSDEIDVSFNQRIKDIHNEVVSLELDRKASLDYINQGYSSRREAKDNSSSTVINKSGVREFVDLFNSAKDSITIQTYQFQNQTIGSSVRDVLRRRVLERIGDSSKEAFKLDLVLAYPKQRVTPGENSTEDTRFNIGGVGYAINGPNLIEALTMKQMEEDLVSELRELGYSSQDIKNAFQVNIEFRDRKFHPKLYMTDTMAAVGTQNLTAPVGNSINQAGSNFEQMYVVHNYHAKDSDLLAYQQGRTQGAISSENVLKDTQLRSSLLYRQIKQASEYERQFIGAQGKGTIPPVNFRRGSKSSAGYNVGFAGDIYKHLTDTLDYAYNQVGLSHGSSSASGYKKAVANQDISMFMILDGAFMLQVGDIAFNEKALLGEMGDEVTKTFSKKDPKVDKYRSYQNKLFDLLITNNANVVVDKKNYKEAVYDPIADKIEKQGGELLKRNFAKAGKNLGLMAGNNIFGADVDTMDRYLQAQGFTDKAGYSASDRKQLMGMGSGNIRMAKAPRQHAKGFGLVDYSGGSPDLVSYYQGSSNMGFYSLDAGDKTNTEIGVMFGKGDKLSRVKNQVFVSSYANEVELEAARQALERVELSQEQLKDFSLTEEQEIDELRNLQDRFYQTYNQLSTNTIQNRYIDNVKNAPMWQSNVNSGALQIQKARLEDLKQSLGLSDTAFNIIERQGEDGGLKSLNITINTASILGSDEFTNSTTPGKKLTFEISVLNSPKDKRIINRNSVTDPRNGEMTNPGMVYFVDKNKLIGNGIFVNDSGHNVDVMGRKNYDDTFKYGTEAGTVNVKTGQSVHMSSIDITTQAFGQIIGEVVSQKSMSDPFRRYRQLESQGKDTELLTDYLAVMLTGRKAHIDKNGNSLDSVDLISQALKMVEFDSLGGDLITKLESSEASTEDIRKLLPSVNLAANSDAKMTAVKNFINTFRIALADEEVNLFGNNNARSTTQRTNLTLNSTEGLLSDKSTAQQFLDTYLIPNFKQLVKTSPEIISEVLKYADTNNYESVEKANLGAKLSMVFEPFLQSVEDTTYGGQQGYYRTLMYGLSNSRDGNTGELMNDYDEGQNLGRARKYARLTALGYTPTTDIHEFLYRSIASGASSTGKTDQGLNSELLKQQGRQVGSAQNFDVLQSVGIGTKIDRSTYVSGFGDELKIDGEFRQSLVAQGLNDAAIANIETQMKKQYSDQNREFMSMTLMDKNGEIQSKATNNMIFFTGSAKKISQLPQRIKNALGARPLYQYGVEAQKALHNMTDPNSGSSTTLKDVTNSYVNNHGRKTTEAIEGQIKYYTDILNNTNLDTEVNKQAVEKLQMLSNFKKDLSVRSVRNSTGQMEYQAGHLFKLGAIYTGKIKSVLSQDQAAYVSRVKEDIEDLFSGPLQKDETLEEREELKQEMIRSYVLRASLDNSGLGKMIAGNDRNKYNIALLQLSGTYTDTFLANPLQGTVYENNSSYVNMKFNNNINMSEMDNIINHKDVVVASQREGYMVTQQMSTKSSMTAEEEDLLQKAHVKAGERNLLKEGDLIKADNEGRFTQLRDGEVIQTANAKRTVSTLRGEIDNTTFGVSSSTATKSTAAYGRQGEFSIDYIFASLERDGNFANNEYLNELIRLRSVIRGGGSRVEGTDSSALVKGVANFAGQYTTQYLNNKGQQTAMNTFQFLESQVTNKFEEGQVGGSLAAMLRSENRQYAFNSDAGYTPLSSMVSGLYNANNFKSFVWSHGATILKETKGTGLVQNNFMLNELLGVGQGSNSKNTLEMARKAASGLLVSFGSSYLQGGDDDEFKAAVVKGLRQGAAGQSYQKLAGVLQITKGLTGENAVSKIFEEIIQKENKDKGLFFSDANLAGLRGLDSEDVKLIMAGDPNDRKTIEASERFMKQVSGMITSQASIIGRQGYMEMSSFSQRQAALMTTAIDLMHQISANQTSYSLPSDIDTGSERMKQVLTSVLGGREFTTSNEDGGLMDEAFQMIQGINEQINMVALYADITYSQSKDPVGTETVGRHEAQHLMLPFLGDIKNFKNGGQLADMQHTFASLMSLSTGANSLMGYTALQNKGFSKRKAWNMNTIGSVDQMVLTSSFTQENFLGFYRSTAEDNSRNVALRREFKKINNIMRSGDYHNLDSQNIPYAKTKDQYNKRVDNLKNLQTDITNYVERFYSMGGGKIEARIKENKVKEINSKIFGLDGNSINKEEITNFLMQRQDLVVMELDSLNNKYNANMDKALGSDATSSFIENMSNKEMFFTLPDLDFQTQDGMALAKVKGSVSTFLPAAAMMKKLGVQHADFIDPLIGVYKDLSELFAPGSIANNAFQKVLASQSEGNTAVLTSSESQALQKVMQAAHRMLPEAQKATQGARLQQAFGAKTKYKGFTSTGIGSMLVPFDAVALSTTKLAEAGYGKNDRKTKALQLTLEKRYSSKIVEENDEDYYQRIKIEGQKVPDIVLSAKTLKPKQYIKDLIPGKSLELNDLTRSIQSRVKNYYDLQLQVLVQGMSKKLESSFAEMVVTSRITREKVNTVLTLVSSGQFNQNRKIADSNIKQVYDLRDKLKSDLSKNKSLSPSDRFLYETNLMNIEGEITRLELGTGLAFGLDEEGKKGFRSLNQQDMEDRKLKRQVFQNVTSVLNESSIDGKGLAFANLGQSEFDIKGYELFDSKYAASKKVSLGELGQSNNVVQHIKDLGGDITDKSVRNKAQVEMATTYLNNLQKQYEGLLTDLRAHSLERDESTVLDKAKEEAAYSEALKAHQNILNSIESAKQEIKNGAYKEKEGFDRVFTSLNASLLINDQVSVQAAEVFRSPPPGSTDPRLHSYRIMNGVTALNRIASLTGAGGMSETRNSTSSYITAVGVVTYGGGDFDGDPYTAIIHQSADTTSKVLESRMIINKNEILIRNLKTELEKTSSPKDIEEKSRKIVEAEKKISQESSKLENNEKYLKNQISQGHENFNARARRQAAEYFGIDERILVQSKDTINKTDYYNDPDTGTQVRGYGSKTYNADDVFALMNTGHGLVEGLDQKGEDLFKLYDTINKMSGMTSTTKNTSPSQAINNLKQAVNEMKSAKKNAADSTSANGAVFKVFKSLLDKGHVLNDPQNIGNEYLADILNKKDAAAAESLLNMFEGLEVEEDKYRSLHNLEDSVKLTDEQGIELMHRFIGGDLFSKIQQNETYSGLMGKGAGMQVTEGGMDVLLKTLGTAGGEVLGKTYNTIIGTTFKDSSLISFAQAVMKKKEDGSDSDLKTLLEEEITNKAKADGSVDPQKGATTYFDNLESALGKARGVQGFMKNIHQLLRDSIKLKSDKDMVRELQTASVTYQSLSEKLRQHDKNNIGNPDYDEIRNEIVMKRDAAINSMSSQLGDGPGLKALTDLNYLITNAKKPDKNGNKGLSSTQFSYMFLDGEGLDSPEFKSMLDRYNAEIEDQVKILSGNPEVDNIKRSRLNDSRIDNSTYQNLINTQAEDSDLRSALVKVAQYQVSNQMTNLVAGYRMSTTLTLTPDKNRQMNNDFLSLAASGEYSNEEYDRLKRLNGGQLSIDDLRKGIVDSYTLPDNPIDVSQDGKASKLRKIEALASYLDFDQSSFYKGNAAQAGVSFDKAIEEKAKKSGLSKEDYILTFEQRYQESRRQASSLFGYAGEGLNTFTNLESLRTDMSNMFKGGSQQGSEGQQDSRIEKLMRVMDAESMQMMTQLIGSDKLMTSGFEVFNTLFEGVLSNVMVDELDKVESNLLEEAKNQNKSATEDQLRNDPEFKKKVDSVKKRVIKRKSIQLMIGGGEGDRSTSIEGGLTREMTSALMENDKLLDEYIKSQEGSLTSQQTEAMSRMAEHLLTKSSSSQGEFDALLDAVGGKVTLSEEERIGRTEEEQRVALFEKREQRRQQTKQRVQEQQDVRFKAAVKQQMKDRKAFADDNPYLRRGSMLSKLGDGLIGSLATNKGSTTLDILVPIALTAIGSAISEGSVDATTMQDLAGATVTAAMYARTGFVDSANQKVYAKRMGMAQATGAMFKFRSGLARYQGQGLEEGEKVALAARDTIVRESISMAVNRSVAPALSRTIAGKLGSNQSVAMDVLTGKQHQAVQQISGNIGASLISAATSTLISGLILKTTVPNPEKNLQADLQNFDVNVATIKSVNQEIAYARAQQAAAEDVEAASSDGEVEISSYNVVTSSTYNADSSQDVMALYEEQEVDMGYDGGINFDFS